jgi:hypothetical protein
MNHSPVLTDVRDGKILYAVALENHRTKFAGMVYLHAKDYADAVNQVLESKDLQRDTRIVAIAPAVGAHAVLDEKDNLKELIV